MTQKEAIDELILDVDYILDEIENHEKFEDEEQGEYQIQAYEDNKKKLEAYLIVLGALDPSLSTTEGLRERCTQVMEERYGSTDAGKLPEPNEIEKELAEIMTPWYKKVKEENGGYGTQLDLETDENAILAQINMEKGEKRVVIGDDPADVDEPCDSDTFAFYPYRGRIQVVYNEYADGEFCDYPIEFQKKALEIIKRRLENS
jgi:hypothetical protein